MPLEPEPRSEWIVRLGMWLVSAWRPYLGWLALFLCIALSMLPALLLQENGWLMSPVLQGRLLWSARWRIAAAWLVGRLAPAVGGTTSWLWRLLQVLLFLLLGASCPDADAWANGCPAWATGGLH